MGKSTGKANQAAGCRFERSIVRKLRAAGHESARLVDETTGYVKGWDIALNDHDVVIQVKATSRPGDLRRGLNEAFKANPNAVYWVCIHSLRRRNRRPEIRVLILNQRGFEILTNFDGFLDWLRFVDMSV